MQNAASQPQEAARVVAFAIEKGGVAKSATTEAFAASLTRRGYRVLCVDMDAQAVNLTYHVGARKEMLDDETGEVLLDEYGVPVPEEGTLSLLSMIPATRKKVLGCIQHTEGFGDVIAATPQLSDYDPTLETRYKRRDVALAKGLAPILGDYDFILIDTPPAMQYRTLSAIAAADDVIIVTTPSSNCYNGMIGAAAKIREDVIETLGRDVHVAGVAVTMVRQNAPRFNREGIAKIEEYASVLGWPVFSSRVSSLQAVDEAQKAHVPLIEYAPDSPAAREYERMVDEYLACVGEE